MNYNVVFCVALEAQRQDCVQRSLIMIVGVVMALAMTTVGLVPGKASANSIGCLSYEVGMTNQTAYFSGETFHYWYTPVTTTPTGTGCDEIIISNVQVPGATHRPLNPCVNFRIKFYPWSGTPFYGSGWRQVCTYASNGMVSKRVMASGIGGGTRYRVEAYMPDNLASDVNESLYRPYYSVSC